MSRTDEASGVRADDTCRLPPIEAVEQLTPEQLPGFVGQLAALAMVAAARLATRPAPAAPLPKRKAEPNANLLTVQEAGERLRKSATSVRRAIKRGELKAQKVGATWRLRESDLPGGP